MQKTISFKELLSLGEKHFYNGQIDYYHKIEKIASNFLGQLAEDGRLDQALSLEPSYYNQLVKKIENEENYYLGFKNHSKIFFRLGVSERLEKPVYGKNPNKLAFIAHTSVLLGHTEVMVNLIKAWKKSHGHVIPYFVGLTPMAPNLEHLLRENDILYFSPNHRKLPTELVGWCAEVLQKNDIETAVWLSTPCWVSYFFGRGLAKKQVMWSLKFHPLNLGEDVIHIGFGKRSEKSLVINQKEWISYSPPLSLSCYQPSIKEIEDVRSQFSGKYIFGTLARTEKFNSEKFIEAVSNILKACPNAIYMYTGRERSKLLEISLAKQGLDGQLAYVGWVDTNLYAAALDCFLETFPFGCGITSLQALSHNVPVVTLWDENTVARVYFENQQIANSYTNNFYCYSDVSEYVEQACNLYNLATKEKTQHSFNELEVDMASRFLDILGIHEDE